MRPRLNLCGGFTLAETIVATGLCVIAFTAIHAAVLQGTKVVKDAQEEIVVSQLLEQRLESMRSRPLWTAITSIAGVRATVSEPVPAASALEQLVESYTVGPYPGESIGFTVTVQPDGSIASSGASLPLSQSSVRVVGTVEWGGASRFRRTRSVSRVFTRGGL